MGEPKDDKEQGPLTRAKESVMGGFDQMTREMVEKDPGEAMADDLTPGTSDEERRRLEARREQHGSPEEQAEEMQERRATER